jgi:hypothetical protein
MIRSHLRLADWRGLRESMAWSGSFSRPKDPASRDRNVDSHAQGTMRTTSKAPLSRLPFAKCTLKLYAVAILSSCFSLELKNDNDVVTDEIGPQANQATSSGTTMLDAFGFGTGTTRPNARAGDALDGLPPEFPDANPAWIADSVVFAGGSGPGNGYVTFTKTGYARLRSAPAHQTTAEVIFSVGNDVVVGWQEDALDKGQLSNRATDKVFARFSISGTTATVTVRCQVGDYVTSSSETHTGISTSGRIKLSLKLNMSAGVRTVVAEAQDQTSLVTWRTREVDLLNRPAPQRSPSWPIFAINAGTGTNVYQAVIGKLVALPTSFPMNMSFKPFGSEPPRDFDILDNAKPEMFPIHHGSRTKLDAITKAYGADKTITIVFNPTTTDGENREPNVGKDDAGLVWPGTWLQKARTMVTTDVGPNTETMSVADSSRIAVNDVVIIYKLVGNPGNATWLALPSSVRPGQPASAYAHTWDCDWEYAEVTKTGPGFITVRRGKAGTACKTGTTYRANQTAVASMVAANWNPDGTFALLKENFSLVAPVHPGTRETTGSFFARGAISALRGSTNDGIEKDVQYALVDDDTDVDLDGLVDGGFKDSVNVYLLGYQAHVKQIRDALGPAVILQYDSIRPRNGYRGYKYINGVQMESFMRDASFSVAFDTLSQWVENVEQKPAFSYGYCREPTGVYGGVPFADSIYRKQFAAGLMVGMPHPYGSSYNVGLFKWDEYNGGKLNKWDWLGAPAAESPTVVQDFSGLSNTNLIAGKKWTLAVEKDFRARPSAYTGPLSDDTTIEVIQVPAGARNYEGVRLYYDNDPLQLVPGAVYTLVFDAMASDTIAYDDKIYEGLPSVISLSGMMSNDRTTVFAAPSSKGRLRTYRLSIVAGSNSKLNTRSSIGFGEAKASFTIKNIGLFAGSADRFFRKFVGGIVYLNATDTPWTVTLAPKTYCRLQGEVTTDVYPPDATGYVSSIQVPPQDAVYLRTGAGCSQ